MPISNTCQLVTKDPVLRGLQLSTLINFNIILGKKKSAVG
jgi:hypothetical protein